MSEEITATYKTLFNDKINDMYAKTKRGELPRDVRMQEIEALTDWYVEESGERPDTGALDRLANLILHEDLTDKDRMKMRNNEYPIMSDEQQARRREGLHSRSSTVSGEVPLGAADSTGVDGRSYGIPSRRARNKRENNFVDKEAKSRNAERKKVYGEFTKVQPVIVVKIGK